MPTINIKKGVSRIANSHLFLTHDSVQEIETDYSASISCTYVLPIIRSATLHAAHG